MLLVKLAAMRGALTMHRREESVLGMGQRGLRRHAATRDVTTMPRREASVLGMARR